MEAGVNGTTGCVAHPGTQTTGYAFGVGQNAWGVGDSDGVGRTVAGGYWGGYTSNTSGSSAGAGGSGYVSGHAECIGIKAEDDTTPKVTKYSEISDSYHYSGKVFKNTTLTAGISDTSKAVITSLKSMDEQVITNIAIDKGHMTREFNPAETDYYIELDSEEAYPIVTVETSGENIIIEGGKVQTVETYPGETVKQIKAIDENGLEYTYNLHFVRKASSDSHLASVKLDGEEIENYQEAKLNYEIVMPYWIEDTINLDGIKKFPNQKVVGLRRNRCISMDNSKNNRSYSRRPE